MATVILALGTNLGDRDRNLDRAVTLLAERAGRIVSKSDRLTTAPLLDPKAPTQGQLDFRNMVMVLKTELSPVGLLATCQAIELELGREPRESRTRWGPRPIDIDIIAMDDRVVETPTLVIPHPEMHKRDFVLAPLVEIWPDWLHPKLHQSARQLLLAQQQGPET